MAPACVQRDDLVAQRGAVYTPTAKPSIFHEALGKIIVLLPIFLSIGFQALPLLPCFAEPDRALRIKGAQKN